MIHFPFMHKWKRRITRYTDISYGGRVASTAIVYWCPCGKIVEKLYYGITLTEDDFTPHKDTV